MIEPVSWLLSLILWLCLFFRLCLLFRFRVMLFNFFLFNFNDFLFWFFLMFNRSSFNWNFYLSLTHIFLFWFLCLLMFHILNILLKFLWTHKFKLTVFFSNIIYLSNGLFNHPFKWLLLPLIQNVLSDLFH